MILQGLLVCRQEAVDSSSMEAAETRATPYQTGEYAHMTTVDYILYDINLVFQS